MKVILVITINSTVYYVPTFLWFTDNRLTLRLQVYKHYLQPTFGSKATLGYLESLGREFFR